MANESKEKELERAYARFHRVLAGLLTALGEEPEVVWLEPPGRHVITPPKEENLYCKAVYPLEEIEPYQEQLEELERAQADALTLLRQAKPTRGLLSPVVLAGVQYARIKQHVNYASTTSSREATIEKFLAQRHGVRGVLEAGGEAAPTRQQAREASERLAELEYALAVLRALEENTVRGRYRYLKSRAYVYLEGGGVHDAYVREVGLILVGRNVRVVHSEEPRQRRSDKVVLEPLFVMGGLEVYSETAWQEEKEKR